MNSDTMPYLPKRLYSLFLYNNYGISKFDEYL